jgi:hypothetical protein
MSPRCVSAAATDVQEREPAAHYACYAGPRPPLPVELMQRRHEQADRKGNTPERHADLEHSSRVADKGLGLFGAHADKPMRLVGGPTPPTPLRPLASTAASGETTAVAALDTFSRSPTRLALFREVCGGFTASCMLKGARSIGVQVAAPAPTFRGSD